MRIACANLLLRLAVVVGDPTFVQTRDGGALRVRGFGPVRLSRRLREL